MFIGFLLASFALAQGIRRWHRAATFGLVLILATFTFAMAVHAVHHLSQPEKAAECLVFSAAQHVTGTLAAPYTLYAPVLAAIWSSLGNFEAPTLIPYFRPDQPRAPPTLPA